MGPSKSIGLGSCVRSRRVILLYPPFLSFDIRFLFILEIYASYMEVRKWMVAGV